MPEGSVTVRAHFRDNMKQSLRRICSKLSARQSPHVRTWGIAVGAVYMATAWLVEVWSMRASDDPQDLLEGANPLSLLPLSVHGGRQTVLPERGNLRL
jgi:hypothetical protein